MGWNDVFCSFVFLVMMNEYQIFEFDILFL